MKLVAKLAIGAVALGGIVWAATAAAKSGGLSSGGKKPGGGGETDPTFDPFHKGADEPTGPGGGGGGGKTSPTLGPGGFRTFPPNTPTGGLVFGHMSDAGISATDWLPNGNTVRFAHDCSVVLVGAQVWKMNDDVSGMGMWHAECVEYSDVKSCWRHGQNLCCRIDSLMTAGITSARSIGRTLITEMEPPCIDQDYDAWPKAMQDFVEWLRAHVNEYVLASSGQADW